jgi:hypothetical protein
MAKEDEIRLIAYKIWEEEGCIDGLDCEHWYRAETIWDQQQKQKSAPVTSKPETRQPAKQIIKGGAAKKKSRKR